MGEGINFERGVEYPDGIHDGVEKNEYESTNVIALDSSGHPWEPPSWARHCWQ